MKSCPEYLCFKIIARVIASVTAALIFSTCAGPNNKSVEKNAETEEIVKVARGLEIIKHKDFTEVLIRNPWQGASNVTMKYILVSDKKYIPENTSPESVIIVPVRKMVCMSTTHVGMISALGEENSIKGISGADFLYSSSLKDRFINGEIAEVGYETNINHEIIIKISPDLLMMYGIAGESASHINKMQELGFKIMLNGDYLETDPLAKAEWIRLFGALYCREEKADSIFNSVAENYNRTKTIVSAKSTERPTVLLGLPFKDTWFISPGNSFVSRLIEDAGGSYIWKNTVSETSMPYGLENVYAQAINADFWINIGTVKRKSEISLVDKRLRDLRCYINGNMYNNNKRVSAAGGNDYWESGAVNPDIVLMDIASVLHPEIFPDYRPVYYQKIE